MCGYLGEEVHEEVTESTQRTKHHIHIGLRKTPLSVEREGGEGEREGERGKEREGEGERERGGKREREKGRRQKREGERGKERGGQGMIATATMYMYMYEYIP